MFIIGLTGGIGSGKSTVSKILEELGAVVIDADQVAREIETPGSTALREIKSKFGASVINTDGTLNRKKLAKIVFSDSRALEELNSITHPKIKKRVIQKIREIEHERPRAVVVIEAPLLLEAGMDSCVDEIWVTAVNEDTQVKRVVERDKLKKEEVLGRIRKQMPLNEILKKADRVINTGGSLGETRAQVKHLWQCINEIINKKYYIKNERTTE